MLSTEVYRHCSEEFLTWRTATGYSKLSTQPSLRGATVNWTASWNSSHTV